MAWLHFLSFLLVSPLLVLADGGGKQFSSPVGSENREYVTVCPTDGRRAVRVDPADADTAQVITTNCAIADTITVASDSTLDLTASYIDIVFSYPDATTLNFAYNQIDYFPTSANITKARSLILRNNNFRSLSKIDVPPQLEYLDLVGCKIATLGVVRYPKSFVKLRLSGNELTSLKGEVFPPSLRAIELSHQPLLSLAGATFPPKLEILTVANTSLTSLNASAMLPESLTTIDLSSNRLSAFPDFYQFPSITDVNVSFNAIESIRGVAFPWTLKRLDLRGNPLKELEIKRSDLKLFQEWSYLLPAIEQSACKHASARRVRVQDVDLCVLEDADFDKSYQRIGADESIVGDDDIPPSTLAPVPISNQTVIPETKSMNKSQSPFSWTFLIIAIATISIVVIGIISMLSWKHQQLRRQVKRIMDRNSRIRMSSFNDDLLRAVGLEGELVATRFDTEEIKILHVLGKAGYGILYLGEMRGESDDDAAPEKLLFVDDRFSGALSAQELESVTSGRQLVTIKRMVPEQSTDKSRGLKAFVEEIQLMSQLDHPKIISFLGVSWNTLADVSMVMEYLPNGDLQTMLKIEKDRLKFGQSKRLRWVESQSSFASTMSIKTLALPSKSTMALDISEAMVYLHSSDPPVILRELRSKYVLFSEHYDAKLSNIGAPSEMLLDVTRAASLDSVAWIAPEILRGDRFTEKADMYAFGILLTELATSSRPFEGLTNSAIVLKVTHDNQRPLIDGTDCPDMIQHFAQLCMSADPAVRPTATEAHRELLALRRGPFSIQV